MAETVTVAQLVSALRLTVVSGADWLETRRVVVSDISRPGLELTGYFNYYPHERLQLFGRTEDAFVSNMTSEERLLVLNRMASDDTPAFIISWGIQPPKEMIQAADAAHIPVLSSKLPTTRLSSLLTNYLEDQLAERQSMHGVLTEIYGLGVLITGDSGVGKSETALELVQRGHRLIADDRVEVYQRDEQTVVGEAPKILAHLLEIRGLGIIDVMNLFGVGAVRKQAAIDLIVHLENWTPDKQFDRLGSGEQQQEIFDVTVPKITIPVKIGRNMASIIEVAAMNFRAKTMGYDATKKFEENLNLLIEENSKE